MSKLLHHPNAAASDAHKLARVAMGALAVCCILSAAAPAAAQRQSEPPRKEQQGSSGNSNNGGNNNNGGNGNANSMQRLDPRTFEARSEELRRMQQESTNAAETTRRIDRMTPDERRDLRRQINQAGQEVYAIPPRR